MARMRSYTAEFRQTAVAMATSQGVPTCESTYVRAVAQELDMSTEPGSLGWLVVVGEAIEIAWEESQNEAGNRH